MAKKPSSPIDNKIRELFGEEQTSKVNTGLYLPANLKDTIDKAAAANGVSFNALVVKILEDFFRRK